MFWWYMGRSNLNESTKVAKMTKMDISTSDNTLLQKCYPKWGLVYVFII